MLVLAQLQLIFSTADWIGRIASDAKVMNIYRICEGFGTESSASMRLTFTVIAARLRP